MLNKEKYFELKEMATKINHDNSYLFVERDNASIDETIKDKEEFLESIIDNLGIKFASGSEGREENIVFRANVLIPNDKEFLKNYNEDKNVRILANKYAVSAEDIINKIFELNKYAQFREENSKQKPSFVSEMLKNSKKEEKTRKNENSKNDDFNGVLEAVTGFASDFKQLQAEKVKMKHQIEKLNEQLSQLDEENMTLAKEITLINSKNDTLLDQIKALNNDNEQLKNDAKELSATIKEHDALAKERILEHQQKNGELEKKLAKAEKVLNSIYESISLK